MTEINAGDGSGEWGASGAIIETLLVSPYETARYYLAQLPPVVLLTHSVLAANILALARKLEERGELSVAPVSKQLNDMVAVLAEAAALHAAISAPTGVDKIADARAKRLAKAAAAGQEPASG